MQPNGPSHRGPFDRINGMVLRVFEESSWQDGFDFNRFGFELRRARIQQAGTVSHSGTIPLVDRRSRPMVTLANACSVAA